jgi:ABC-type branched-subunit amino acid transport system substrate-binding protein
VVRAERLAFSQRRSEVSAFQVTLAPPLTAAKISANARAAIEDSHSIAYLGELVPGTSSDSIGITNAQDLLQVSPTDTAAALTRKAAAVAGSPSRYYESFGTYGQTFARVVPSTQREAVALLGEMRGLGVKALQVQSDGSDYGRTLSSEITAAESGQSIAAASSASSADAVLYAGSSRAQALSALNAAAAANPRVKLFVASALADPAFVLGLDSAAQRRLYASTPGLAAPGVAAARFVAEFRSAYRHSPAPQAIFGYCAMQIVLDALRTAGAKANDRSTVVGNVAAHTFADTVLGSVSIDRYGDSSFAGFVIEHVKAGKLVTVKALQG